LIVSDMEGINIVQLLSWSGFVNGIFALGIGLFILWTDWRKRVNQLFFVFTIPFAVWSFNYARWLALDSNPSALYNADISMFWSRWLNFGALWIPIMVIQWMISAFDFDPKKYKHVKYVLSVVTP
jgi:hypothetical protein